MFAIKKVIDQRKKNRFIIKLKCLIFDGKNKKKEYKFIIKKIFTVKKNYRTEKGRKIDLSNNLSKPSFNLGTYELWVHHAFAAPSWFADRRLTT